MLLTLRDIRKHNPCRPGWHNLLRHLPKETQADDPFSILKVLEFNGIDDAVWTLRALPNSDAQQKDFILYCALLARPWLLEPLRHLQLKDLNKGRYVAADMPEKDTLWERFRNKLSGTTKMRAQWEDSHNRAAERLAGLAVAASRPDNLEAVRVTVLPVHQNIAAIATDYPKVAEAEERQFKALFGGT